jgi:hypothetical protein
MAVDPAVEASQNPEVVPDNVLAPEEIPNPGREFIPNQDSGGTTVFAKEGTAGETEGFFTYFTGQPVFLPKDIATQLGKFFLNE